MGGGASAMQGVDELLSTTYMIGRAISVISFPGMYRIYDFHSSKAPRLKNQRQFTFFAPDSDDENEDQLETPDESAYSHLFNVLVGEDRIYLENPIEANEAGWTPLHTCCMSFLTVAAGLLLLEEITKRGRSVDSKTVAGPGTFNSEWTAFHMACAYGIAQLAERLLEEGANVNTTNSFGYTPMLEACHRGFQNIVELLIRGGADLKYIPSAEESNLSPFVSAPAQTALAESARCGFHGIVQVLLNAGAPKDQANTLGWTALHEACFYNRIEVVKVLLLSGANATLRTRGGALPYHLAGLQIMRSMLLEMGGPEAIPAASDTIDMVAILRELTMPEMFLESSEGPGPSNAEIQHKTTNVGRDRNAESPRHTGNSKSGTHALADDERSNRADIKYSPGREEKASPMKSAALLHSGGVLGDLPAFNTDKYPKNTAGSSSSSNYDRALEYGDSPSEYPTGQSMAPSTPSKGKTFMLDSRADGKEKSSLYDGPSSAGKLKMKKKRAVYTPPPDFPKSYLCQLSQRPMSEPVKSIYGNIFDRPVILGWLSKQGHVCPLSGAPLSESDLKPLEEMTLQIRDWILLKSQTEAARSDTQHELNNLSGDAQRVKSGNSAAGAVNDDLYDF